MAEGDRPRLAPVLAADAELQLRLRRPAALDGDPHQVADAAGVQGLEGVLLQHAVLEVVRQELALRVVAGEAKRSLRQVVGAEGEEVGLPRDLVGSDAGARELDHRAAEVLHLRRFFLRDVHGQLAQPPQFLLERHERMHDLDERRLPRAVLDGVRGTDDRAHLHLVDLRPLEAEPAATRAEHRVRLLQLLDAAAHALVRRLLERRQELMQRRIEEPDRHRQAGHRLEDRLEVALLHRQQLVEGGAASFLVHGKDHLAHDGQPVVGHEHVLGPAEADPLRTEVARFGCVSGRVRVRAHLQPAVLVAPAQDRLEVVVHLRGNERHLADDHCTRAPVDGQDVPFRQGLALQRDRPRVDVDRKRVAAGHARLPHPARHDGGV